MAHHNFHRDDIVVLKSGTSPQKIIKTNGTQVMTQYLSGSIHEPKWRDANSKLPQPQEEPKMKLYQVTAEPEVFGTLLASDSTGKMVLELKPSGTIKAYKPDELTEVRPYTVQASNGEHYITTKGMVMVGDVVGLKSGLFVSITKLDTNHNTTTQLEGRKVLTEVLG
jgi:uncharacterized protein YodC (DUF2158 family)